jgi:hypothetical protein
MNIDKNIDIDSDSDEYIDLSNNIKDNLKHIFQFHLFDNKLLIKYIGKSSIIPDIIIMENFGSESNMCLYNCVYSHEELELKSKSEYIIESEFEYKLEKNDIEYDNIDNNNENKTSMLYPIIKLVIKKHGKYSISSIAIKLNQNIIYEKEIKEWELYFIENDILNKDCIKTKKIEKNINPSNILEKLIKLSLYIKDE